MTKFLKFSLVILLCISAFIAAAFAAFFIITKDAKLNESKLINPDQSIIIIDDNGNEVVNASLSSKNKSVKLENLHDYTKNAFIASEDRTFYSHNGLNYKRMVKALFKNIAAGSFKEGASTISQQLIKNTHLSQDKTIKRKLNEIKLTKQLEKRYSKDEILEMYLNTIYFGHNCYGLQSAAQFYFDKRAEELNLTESATLVGLLTSPNNFSPFKNPEKSLNRRNTVLKAMLTCNYIDENAYGKAVKEPLNAHKPVAGEKNYDYLNAVFDELEETNLPLYGLNGCIIKTYLKPDLQSKIENLAFETDNSVIITSQGSVSAYKSTINGAKRQPGSTIKPLAVYAPAIDEKLISPFTKILDEKISYGGYSPENYDKKYHGYVSVTDSLSHSYNIPAVKTLNALTVQNSEKYLSRMGIKLENDEKNLSLALGGMKYGLNLHTLADCYSVFPSGGFYSRSRFIKEITTNDGKTIYKKDGYKNRVFSEGASSLMNSMLLETSKSGTAKKLKNYQFDIASKTGTCGNEDGNTDAYAISYTSEHTIGVWLGDKNNKKLSVTGGGACCNLIKEITDYLYSSHSPENLNVTGGTNEISIDADEYYDNNKVMLSDPTSPKYNRLTVRVLAGNEPKETSTRFSSPVIQTPALTVTESGINIELCHAKYYEYIIKRNNKVIFEGKIDKIFADTPPNGNHVYSVTPYYKCGENKIYGKEISLPSINFNNSGSSPQEEAPDIVKKDWFDL